MGEASAHVVAACFKDGCAGVGCAGCGKRPDFGRVSPRIQQNKRFDKLAGWRRIRGVGKLAGWRQRVRFIHRGSDTPVADSGAKARVDFTILTARLKSCPVTKRSRTRVFSHAVGSCPFKANLPRRFLLPIPCSLLPVPYSLFPTPCSLLPVPYSLLPISAPARAGCGR